MEGKTLTGLGKRFAAAACAAAICSCAFAGSAFAATVHGADFHGAGSAIESGEVDVLDVDGTAGETVFLTVKQDGTAIAKNLPYTIGEGADEGDSSEYAGVATLDIDGLDLSALDGTYTIEAYATRAGGDEIYSGAVYGVYADLPDGTQKLIGTRTASAGELESRAFEPAETLYTGGKTYRLTGESSTDGGVMHFAYEAYDEATTVDGVIKYNDATGNTVATTKIAGLEYGESRTVDIPTAITADDGSLYRTVCFQSSVTAENPGRTSFNIYCVKMSEASKALAGFYIATINMVDEDGNVIASDSVNVTGEFVYTAPSEIYKTEMVDGEATVVTYKLAESPTIRLSAANDGVLNRVRTIAVSYEAQPLDDKQVEVTFNLLDGSKRVGDKDRSLGKQRVTATEDEPTVVPEQQIEVDGSTYYLAGEPSDYAYTLGSGATPSVDVFYTPEGYSAPGSYDVTVNYVNFSTNSVIESHTYATDPDENSRITIDTPDEFSADGVDYVRLAGQEGAIAHSYYSGIESYTVYYRDVNDELSSGVVINTIRVVYRDGGTTSTTGETTTTTTSTTGETTTTVTGATGATGEAAGADAAEGAATGDGAAAGTAAAGAADGTTAYQLDDSRTYNVMDGDEGNSTLTNESGVDSNTERIEDSETPLAAGFDKGASSSAASSFTQLSQWLLPAGIAAAVAVIAIVAVVVIRRRNDDEELGM